jgi:diguanylate cyclase (GGDEF)-like protein
MNQADRTRRDGEQRKRTVLSMILILSWVSTAIAWFLMGSRGALSPALRGVFFANIVFHPVMFVIVRQRLLSQRVIDMTCLVFAAAICAGCMALRLYFPVYGFDIDLKPLYLWIPVIYVFAFTLTGRSKAALAISLVIMALFFVISLPYLVHHSEQPDGNFTIQLHIVSAVLVGALYFFSSYQRNLQLAQLTVDELGRLANTDVLTKLPNRRRIAEAVESELVRFARYGRAFSMILIDIDHFKAVNDRFGHAIGDQTLVAMAARAREILRDVDMLGRWGGEEFVVILPETTLDEGLRKAEALCAHIAGRPLSGGFIVTISCGVTRVTAGDIAESLFQRADKALYAAKERGRNRVESMEGSWDRSEDMTAPPRV